MTKTLFPVLALCFALNASADPLNRPEGLRVQISGQAAREVANDLLAVTLSAEKEAETREQAYSAGAAASKQGAEAFRGNPAILVRSSHFAIHPVFDKKGSERAYRYRYSVRLESRDFAALLKLAGSVAGQYAVESLQFMISPELRRNTEAQLMTEVVKDIRTKAAQLQGELGVARLQLAEIDYTPGASIPQPRHLAMPMRAAAAPIEELSLDSGVGRIEIGARAVLQSR